MKKFQIPTANDQFFYHFDCYRLESPEDILQLGFEEITSDPKNIVAIEWPEKILKLLPRSAIKIQFTHLKGNQRKIRGIINLAS